MTASGTGDRHAQLAAFYTEHHHRLCQRVRHHAGHFSDADLADACAYGWLQLVRRHDVHLDHRGLAWLTLVASQELWRIARTDREFPAGVFHTETETPGELIEPQGLASDPIDLALDAELHRTRLHAFQQLKPRERRELFLHAGGYRYHEIAQATASSYTAVNRRIAEGRNRLRRVEGANFPAARLPAV